MTFIIAEMSANHGGSLAKAQEMVAAARWAGCDAVKFQLYGRECLPDYDDKANISISPWFDEIVRYCNDDYKPRRIKFIVSVFSWWGLTEALKHSLYAYKLASPQSTRLPRDTYRHLAQRIKEYHRTLYISTGLADYGLMAALTPDVLFYCPSGHPAILGDHDLWWFAHGMAFSDHTVGIQAPLAAIQAGATHIEKHFKLDDNCVDAAFSLNPDQMKMLCDLAK